MVLLPDTRQQLAAGAFSEFQYDDNTAAMCVFVSVQCVGVGLCVCARFRFGTIINVSFNNSSFGKNRLVVK